MWHVREVLSHEDILTLDNGIYKLWFSRLYRTYKPNTFLLDNALATMGAGLPAGIMPPRCCSPTGTCLPWWETAGS